MGFWRIYTRGFSITCVTLFTTSLTSPWWAGSFHGTMKSSEAKKYPFSFSALCLAKSVVASSLWPGVVIAGVTNPINVLSMPQGSAEELNAAWFGDKK